MLPVKFVIYKSKAGFSSLETKDLYTLYFVQETLEFYQGGQRYNDVIEADELPDNGIPFKFYLVGGEDLYLKTPTGWVHLNAQDQGGGGVEAEGITLNGKTIGGVKQKIERGDILIIPEYWQYNVKNYLTLEGSIDNEGVINVD